jgi:hypothetical protein
MMMLEKNELQIAAFMAGWLQDNVEKGIAPATRQALPTMAPDWCHPRP